MKAVILAGGKGTRLAPHVPILPKPLMPIDGMPILEVLLRQLKRYGFEDVTLTIGHLSQLFEAFFRNGEKWGVDLKYSLENDPLGTAGPLSLIEDLGSQTFMVSNGDVLTDLDFGDLLSFHRSAGGIATLAVCQRQVQVDLGIVRAKGGGQVTEYMEKPIFDYTATMGINMFEPKVVDYIPAGQYLDFPDLVLKMIAAGEKVFAYHHHGYWKDLGHPVDYQQAVEEFSGIRNIILKEE